ncbi:PIN domain-containing protein [Bacillus subtilis]|uniref:PIN domain-containing protein n=1 Tax=Bacillus subtilis TaxID=1423 RepID=UPI0007EAB166|nr:PIN domain-containing protein [Bacillus subtilis]MDW4547543.1 PIN domain-containing protein [Bacillus subtilis subsp. subtilis]OAZ70477.1 hypothetical protein SRCM101280_01115 [Bacillus subtilis]QAW14851.1 hypothetical protein ETA10_21860 [Bacillus subtilis]QHM12344.1 hypothetical protein C7M28_04171 [Bacillus subtilis]
MNFFLDTNILFKDPFLQNNFNQKLIEMVKLNQRLKGYEEEQLREVGLDPDMSFLNEDFKIYVSRVVYKEAKAHYIKRVNDRFKQLRDINRDLSWFMNDIREISPHFTKEQYENRFDQYYSDLGNSGVITILDVPEITNELIERAVKKEEPFFNNEKNEFRDATIWLTYSSFAESMDLGKCYFITDNVTDFCRKNDKDMVPVPLHPKLREECDRFKMYRSSQGLFTSDDDFKEYLQEYQETALILNGDLGDRLELLEALQKIKDEKIDNSYLLNLLTHSSGDIFDIIEHVLDNKIRNHMDVDSFMDEFNFGGYLQPQSLFIDIISLEVQDSEIFDETVLVSATIKVPYDIAVYLYNPVYDNRDEKYEFSSTQNVVFSIPVSFQLDQYERISNFECDIPQLDKATPSLGYKI